LIDAEVTRRTIDFMKRSVQSHGPTSDSPGRSLLKVQGHESRRTPCRLGI
jgi:hypothetical protein